MQFPLDNVAKRLYNSNCILMHANRKDDKNGQARFILTTIRA